LSYPDDYISTNELVKTGYYQLNAVHHKTAGTKYLLKKFFRVDTQQVAALRSGVELMRELQLDMLLEPVELFEQGVQASILYADFPAIALRKFLQEKKTIPADIFLKIAKSLTHLLAGFHSRGWIIKNLSPENILLNVSNYSCKLSDLRTATRIFKKEQQLSQKQDILEIRYYSPEQTGRISQITDFRADLYALGVILYELITGRPPFDFTDPVEIIHAHLAIPPVAPMKIRTDFPRVLNDIVMKLLSKSPEERYQGCEGLLFDLNNSEKTLSSSESFKLGTKDRVSKIVPTSKMIGRREEIFQLEKAYESSRKGKKQAVYIRGYSGVGKTRVVKEFQRNKLTDRVPIVSSKFDTLQRGTPYSALLEAMKSLIRKILLDEDEKVNYWKNRLNAYLRNNGNIIAEVIPELEILTGELQPVDPLPPDESQKRFQQTFISFISCFTSDDHSLILFLDDLQWADIASLRLIELILMDESIKNFLFIGAYRENEVDATHPLSLSLAKQEKWVPIVPLQILPLRKDQTSELIIETLHYPVVRSSEFVERIFQKTGGNVFFYAAATDISV
jgi:serine/threonine protein kinase